MKVDLTPIQLWLQGLKVGNKAAPKLGFYDGRQVYIYNQTVTYCLVSYTEDGKGLFTVDLKDLK